MDFISFKSIKQLNDDVYKNIHLFSHIDLVVGVPRSGMLVASIIALLLNVPLTDLNSFVEGNTFESGFTKRENIRGGVNQNRKINVLIVEDSVLTGHSINNAKEKIHNNSNINADIEYLGAYVTSDSKDLVDYYLDVVDRPRIFEWNYLHHFFLCSACCDIDGVLNLDPNCCKNDDGEKYINFCLNAKQKLIPTRKIGWLVTSRLEKYRKETESWLADHNIQYGELIMLDGYTAKERSKQGVHAKFKASVYGKLDDALWFIESNKGQAIEINRITGKPVFCTENQHWYPATSQFIAKETKKEKYRSIVTMIKSGDKQLIRIALKRIKRIFNKQ